MAPLRFVVACAAGHIDDFPWARWAHSKLGSDLSNANPCNAPDLKLMETGSAGLAGLKAECRACGASRTMLGASGPRTLEGLGCSGARPWLGPEASEKCQAADPPVVLQRGASNLYFSSVVSSILIPPYSERARQLVEVPSIWSGLSAGLVNGKIDRVRLEMVATMKGVDVDDLRKAAEAKLAAEGGVEAESEVEYRFSEYTALVGSKGKAKTDGDFLAMPVDMTRYQEITRSILGRIVLVEKLAETRALVGFSRIEPGSAGYTAMVDWQKLAIRRPTWLPAIRVYGEGIFIELSPEALTRWTGGARWTALASRAQQLAAARGLPARELDGVFVALHTLAHTLIRRLSFECGYGSSSLRERIYYSPDPRTKMAGVLIYTAAGDAEGTLGGLVAQGKPGFFDNIFARAVRDLLWCSADPVCSESGGQGTDSLNLAACHACTLLPETSCEEGNRLLDRASLMGTQGRKQSGLMSSVLKQIQSRLL